MTYCDFPYEHWTRIRTNNVIERLNREIRRRTRVVGTFPDGNSVLMLVCARLSHVGGTQWGNKKYMIGASLPGRLYSRLTSFTQSPQTYLRIILDTTQLCIIFRHVIITTLFKHFINNKQGAHIIHAPCLSF